MYESLYEYAVDACGSGNSMYSCSYALNILLVPPVQPQLDTIAGVISALPQPACLIWYTYGGNVRSGTTRSFFAGMRAAMLQVNTQVSQGCKPSMHTAAGRRVPENCSSALHALLLWQHAAVSEPRACQALDASEHV